VSKASARALWILGPGRAGIRDAAAPPPGPGEVRVRALFGGISRGTESLVLRGGVPESERDRMRCPFQEGDFPFPVKYGYALVGVVEAGAPELLGRVVFCLHPHQTRFTVPADAVHPLPAAVPPGRAVLAANMETALNALWDAGVRPGDRVAVVGGGVVGCLVARLAAAIPGTETTLVDLDPARAALAVAFGAGFARPEDAPRDCDLVFHASGSPAGLSTALACAGFEARVVELSWYGDAPVQAMLGGAFHSRRLSILSSQVGSVAAPRRARWTHARRLAKALDLLADPRLEALISGETAFSALGEGYAAALADPATLCHRIRYDAEGEE
jgi:threonine dehydrogenase-like Zn-dependent dehydrogenase